MSETSVKPLTFTSEGLSLEAVLHRPASSPCPAAVVCHPHPLRGGDMQDYVVTAICEALAETGIAALRFNFRGVGRSEGSFGDGVGERTDAAAALAYVRQLAEVEADKVGIVGYSFGAAVALVAADERLAAVTAVSTPTFGQGIPELVFRCPTLLISGDQDQVAPAARLVTLAHTIGPQCQVAIVRGADHFWWGQEKKLAGVVAQFFRECLLGAGQSPHAGGGEQRS